jgi:hypothetical protein
VELDIWMSPSPLFLLPLFFPPPLSPLSFSWKALDIPFYRYKEMVQLYNGGVAMC